MKRTVHLIRFAHVFSILVFLFISGTIKFLASSYKSWWINRAGRTDGQIGYINLVVRGSYFWRVTMFNLYISFIIELDLYCMVKDTHAYANFESNQLTPLSNKHLTETDNYSINSLFLSGNGRYGINFTLCSRLIPLCSRNPDSLVLFRYTR